jgi:hypothetical protein
MAYDLRKKETPPRDDKGSQRGNGDFARKVSADDALRPGKSEVGGERTYRPVDLPACDVRGRQPQGPLKVESGGGGEKVC